MRIIGFTSLAGGTGKDMLAEMLVAQGWTRVSFADLLYNQVAEAFGVTVAWLQRRDQKEVPQDELKLSACKDPNFVDAVVGIIGGTDIPCSPRKILQLWGTEYRREYCNVPNYWVDAVVNNLKDNESYVFTDVRFPNESDALINKGAKIFRIRRPAIEAMNQTSHPSDKALADHPFTDIFNVGTPEDAFKELTSLL